ncbi:MAG: hypothetical protein K5650_00195 [Bacteroidales bacterium]|nr:hypothetical protein [Bacteroidales bacterium]
MDEQHYIKKIRSAAAVSLWASVGLGIVTALYYFASKYRFYASDYTVRWMTIAATVLAVLAVGMTLLTLRRQVPALRQASGLDRKLKGYASMVANVYGTLLFVVAVLCAAVVLTNRNVLFMLVMVVAMVMFLAYPNPYRVKHDLGLTDEQMSSLYGDKYLPANDEQ